ncbi:nitrite/sulfite reductase [Helicobacter sp. MIT 14-3879]|uniref:nitrite/sulfite reductase n=1 Tax=Helicobacter sp. MIT 14-3879 TaxID=2040649 RepID=UPI000E1F1023|nr:nitrite/sulfite reductase [Helicobacter sp. MIT 14-3879]RDU64753.1 sulfite reductase subunit beta (hemoprotein) [Helicobacter sp. MIT 14-3879]
MSNYKIPDSVLKDDFISFKESYKKFINKEIDEATFKAIRVPYGIYEQRERNTYMIRVKTNGGQISPKQLLGLSKFAKKYANLKLHITTRGGIQLHYAKLEDLCEIIESMHSIGITGRGSGGGTVRNIASDPLSGVAQDDVFDVQPYANALTTKMLELKDSFNLPKKYKIAFSSSGADRAMASITDVGFIARIKDSKKGFIVYVAGGMGAKSRLGYKLFDFIPDNEAFLVAEAVKQIFNRYGDREKKSQARLRFVAEKLGEEELTRLILEEIRILRNSIDWEINVESSTLELPILNDLELPTMNDSHKLWWDRFANPQKQKGYFYLKVPLKLGDIPCELAEKLAIHLEDTPSGSICFASNQNLYLRHLTPKKALELYSLILELSPQSLKPTIIGDMVACTGAATCQLGIARPRGAVLAIEEYLLQKNIDLDSLQGFRIQMSGCPNSCGNHATANLGFFGKAKKQGDYSYPAYNIVVGAVIGEGKTRFAKKIADISAFRLPEFVYAVLKTYLEVKNIYPRFEDWIDADGEEKIIAIAKEYKEIPDFEQDKRPYYDYTSDKLFGVSMKERGIGEENNLSRNK